MFAYFCSFPNPLTNIALISAEDWGTFFLSIYDRQMPFTNEALIKKVMNALLKKFCSNQLLFQNILNYSCHDIFIFDKCDIFDVVVVLLLLLGVPSADYVGEMVVDSFTSVFKRSVVNTS